jgi:hypothetical protein
MFSNYGSMYFARVGPDNISVHQLRKHELMDSRGGADPAKFIGGSQLFRAKRAGTDDFSSAGMLFRVVAGGKVNNYELGKIPPPSLGKPGGRIRKLAAVVEDDSNSHGLIRCRLSSSPSAWGCFGLHQIHAQIVPRHLLRLSKAQHT